MGARDPLAKGVCAERQKDQAKPGSVSWLLVAGFPLGCSPEFDSPLERPVALVQTSHPHVAEGPSQ